MVPLPSCKEVALVFARGRALLIVAVMLLPLASVPGAVMLRGVSFSGFNN